MKLPEIFKNKLDDSINNNEKIYMSNRESNNEDILANLPVQVILSTNKYQDTKVTIIGKTKNYLITRGGETIYIKDIIALKKA